jgi:hypothetical protein
MQHTLPCNSHGMRVDTNDCPLGRAYQNQQHYFQDYTRTRFRKYMVKLF